MHINNLNNRFDTKVPPYLQSPECTWEREGGERACVCVQVCQSVFWMHRINMAAAHSNTGTRTLFRTLLTRCRSPAPGQTRTGPGQHRYLSSLPPPPGTWSSELSRLSHQDLHRLSVTDPDQFWGSTAADRLRWMKPFHRVRDCELSSGKISWFLGGKINVSGERQSVKPIKKLFDNQ